MSKFVLGLQTIIMIVVIIVIIINNNNSINTCISNSMQEVGPRRLNLLHGNDP